MKYNSEIHKRRSIRLKEYDYSQAGLYFITLCCQNRLHLFGEVKNGEMDLNIYGQIASIEWQQTEQIRENCLLHEFIIMPNHMHGIIEIIFSKGKNEVGKFQSPSQTIGAFIRGFKIATIKKIKDKINSKGELQFAPTIVLNEEGKRENGMDDIEKDNKGESKEGKGELQFAPTEITEIIKSLEYKIWQRNYYEHIIQDEQAYQNIAYYITNNPQKWQEDKFYLTNENDE